MELKITGRRIDMLCAKYIYIISIYCELIFLFRTRVLIQEKIYYIAIHI